MHALVHVGAGIGNVVLATPLIVALDALGFRVDLWLSADYLDTHTLLRDWSLVGTIYRDGEAIEFDRFGNLYVSDNFDDHLYQVDPATAAITAIVDNDEKGGLTDIGPQLKTEGLAWDPLTDTMVATDDKNDLFYIQTLENGNNTSLGSLPGLLDVEAIDFLVSCYMNVGKVTATVSVAGISETVMDSDPSHYCN